MEVSIFGVIDSKLPVEVLGRFDSVNGVQYQQTPKGTSLLESVSFEP